MRRLSCRPAALFRILVSILLLLPAGCGSGGVDKGASEGPGVHKEDAGPLAPVPDGGVSSYDYPPDDDVPAVFVELRSAVVSISAPNYGYHLSTELSLVTLEGVAREDVEVVTWSVVDGASGTADGVQTWSAGDIPLRPGDNVIIVTGTYGEGEEGSDVIVVASTPGVPLASDLVLSEGVIFAGIPDEVHAGVQLNGDVDSVVVGPADESGALLEEWGALEQNGAGTYWSGSFVLDESEVRSYRVRAFAAVGDKTGATPAVGLKVMELPEPEFWMALEHLGDEMGAVYAAADPADPFTARDAVIEALLAHPLVDQVGTSVNDGPGLWWNAQGIAFVMPYIPETKPVSYNKPSGSASADRPQPADHKGPSGVQGRPRSKLPVTNYPGSGLGSPQASTSTSHGPVGPARLAEHNAPVRSGPSNIGNGKAIAIQVTSKSVVSSLSAKLSNNSCPTFSTVMVPRAEATFDGFRRMVDHGLILIGAHPASTAKLTHRPLSATDPQVSCGFPGLTPPENAENA